MRSIHLVPFLGLAACGGGGVGTWQPAEIHSGTMVVTSEFGGQPVRWLLDTGAQLTIFHTSLAGTEDPSIAIGDDILDLFPVYFDTGDAILAGLEPVVGPIDGIVGWDAVLNRRGALTLDYANARMRLSKSGKHAADVDEDDEPPLGDPLVVEMSSMLVAPVIDAKIQDVETRMIADTGASVIQIQPDVFDTLAEPPETTSREISTADGVLQSESGIFSTVEVGGEVLADVDFVSYDSVQIDGTVASGTDVDGLIGASVLLRHVVTYDTDRSELTLQPYDDATQERLLGDLHSSNARTAPPPLLGR